MNWSLRARLAVARVLLEVEPVLPSIPRGQLGRLGRLRGPASRDLAAVRLHLLAQTLLLRVFSAHCRFPLRLELLALCRGALLLLGAGDLRELRHRLREGPGRHLRGQRQSVRIAAPAYCDEEELARRGADESLVDLGVGRADVAVLGLCRILVHIVGELGDGLNVGVEGKVAVGADGLDGVGNGEHGQLHGPAGLGRRSVRGGLGRGSGLGLGRGFGFVGRERGQALRLALGAALGFVALEFRAEEGAVARIVLLLLAARLHVPLALEFVELRLGLDHGLARLAARLLSSLLLRLLDLLALALRRLHRCRELGLLLLWRQAQRCRRRVDVRLGQDVGRHLERNIHVVVVCVLREPGYGGLEGGVGGAHKGLLRPRLGKTHL
mmetsp:Transcript_392/g.1108  ORF Transcript_392/g.1108 Transcript_392/m.1108 type:complete len:382 (+) Transcript_392:151-1296(+)